MHDAPIRSRGASQAGRRWTLLVLGTAALVLNACGPQEDAGLLRVDAPGSTLQHEDALEAVTVPIRNPGFEEDWTGWSHVGASYLSNLPHAGMRSGKVTGSSGRIEQTVGGLRPNTHYTLSLWVLGVGRFGVSGFGGTSVSKTFSAKTWVQSAVSFTTGSTNTSVTIFASYNGGTGRFDDLTLVSASEEIPAPSCSKLPILAVVASADDGNVAANAVDGNLSTRWSAEGNGVWIRFDLGEERLINTVRLAWYRGDVRSSRFEIKAGTTATSLTTIHSGSTAGHTLALEDHDVVDSTARFVSVVGYGNTVNAWTSITEVEICGRSLQHADAGVVPVIDAGSVDASVGVDAGVPVTELDPLLPPGRNFDLSHWKLTIPGPVEVPPNEMVSYTSRYFFTDPTSGAMVFWLDSGADGTTANSNYVRSELREMLDPRDKTVNWKLSGIHVMNAELEMPITAQTPSQVTVLQIHGIANNGDNEPPLLRVALINGDLYAWLKTNSSGSSTAKILLESGIKSNRFSAEVRVENYRLTLKVNDVVRMDRMITYWNFHNYFKAGDYAQATSGISEVHFHKLTVSHQGG